MASRKPEDLHPDMLPKYRSFIQGCKEQGIDILTTCTYRPNEEQADLYAQGRTKPERLLPKLRLDNLSTTPLLMVSPRLRHLM